MMDVDLAATASDTFRRAVKALQGFYDVTVDDLTLALRISKASVYRRLNGELEFTAGEVAVLGRLFGCSLDDLFTGNIKFDNERLLAGITFRPIAPQTGTANRSTHTPVTVECLTSEQDSVTKYPQLTLVPPLSRSGETVVTRPQSPSRTSHLPAVA